MYNTEVFMHGSCKVDTATILNSNGEKAKAEKDGVIYDAEYDHDYKMYVIEDTNE